MNWVLANDDGTKIYRDEAIRAEMSAVSVRGTVFYLWSAWDGDTKIAQGGSKDEDEALRQCELAIDGEEAEVNGIFVKIKRKRYVPAYLPCKSIDCLS